MNIPLVLTIAVIVLVLFAAYQTKLFGESFSTWENAPGLSNYKVEVLRNKSRFGHRIESFGGGVNDSARMMKHKGLGLESFNGSINDSARMMRHKGLGQN